MFSKNIRNMAFTEALAVCSMTKAPENRNSASLAFLSYCIVIHFLAFLKIKMLCNLRCLKARLRLLSKAQQPEPGFKTA